MAMRDMLIKRFSRQTGAAEDRAPSQLDGTVRLALREGFEGSDLAWFWATDAGKQAMPCGGSRRRFIPVDISVGSARAA